MSGLIDCEKGEKGLLVETLENQDALRKMNKLSVNQGSSFATWRRGLVISVTTLANSIIERRLSLDWIGRAYKTTKPAYYVGYSLKFMQSQVIEPLGSKKSTQATGLLSRRTVKTVRRDLMRSERDLQAKTTLEIPVLAGRDFLLTLTHAFESITAPTKHLLEIFTTHEDGASSLAAMAAFCQILQGLPVGHDMSERCKEKRDDYHGQIIHYRELQRIVEQETDLIFMPKIQDGPLDTVESQMVRVDSWLGGDMPVFVPSIRSFIFWAIALDSPMEN